MFAGIPNFAYLFIVNKGKYHLLLRKMLHRDKKEIKEANKMKDKLLESIDLLKDEINLLGQEQKRKEEGNHGNGRR